MSRGRQLPAIGRLAGGTAAACLLALLSATAAACPVVAAPASHVDGISDQSLPAWDGSFATSRFAGQFRERWNGGGGGQIKLARYVLQWDAMTLASAGANSGGNYRERFEAWLQDARSLALTPVLALTSYDNVHPGSPGEYRAKLEAILARAAALGYPIAYVEPWNEPNGQGRETAVKAAQLANAAEGACEPAHACKVIAGDFEDRPSVPAYERAYERALTFSPSIWGVHPYVSVRSHNDTIVRRLIAELPAHGAGQQIWFTEVGALYCSRGEVRGEARQASDASYLVNALLTDPSVAPAHVFYYGFLFADGVPAPCSPSVGEDSELYRSSGEARPAAEMIFRTPIAVLSSEAPAAAEWPPWMAAASAMIEPLPGVSQGREGATQ
jgi:hypothetical protein